MTVEELLAVCKDRGIVVTLQYIPGAGCYEVMAASVALGDDWSAMGEAAGLAEAVVEEAAREIDRREGVKRLRWVADSLQAVLGE